MSARRLLVRLSEARDILPASLFIRGVKGRDREPTFGGTCAYSPSSSGTVHSTHLIAVGDIFMASFNGQEVALKKIRVFQRDQAVHRIRQVLVFLLHPLHALNFLVAVLS
jgi:hypothetical protein